jgi:hypothetical protein
VIQRYPSAWRMLVLLFHLSVAAVAASTSAVAADGAAEAVQTAGSWSGSSCAWWECSCTCPFCGKTCVPNDICPCLNWSGGVIECPPGCMDVDSCLHPDGGKMDGVTCSGNTALHYDQRWWLGDMDPNQKVCAGGACYPDSYYKCTCKCPKGGWRLSSSVVASCTAALARRKAQMRCTGLAAHDKPCHCRALSFCDADHAWCWPTIGPSRYQWDHIRATGKCCAPDQDCCE